MVAGRHTAYRSICWALGLAWGTLHLALVLLGAFGRLPQPNGPVGALLGIYRNLSGAGDTFGFFSPAVPDQITVQLTRTTASGRQIGEAVGVSRSDLDFHLATVIFVAQKLGTSDLLARAMAVWSFNHHPDDRSVRVQLSDYRLPSMDAYRHGKRAVYHPFYEEEFALKGAP